MIFGKTKLEFKVGIFVFIGVGILALFVLSIGGIKTWTSGYRINFIFNFINGVKIGAPVRFAGVDVGEVKKIIFFLPENEKRVKIKVVCWVIREAKIPVDSSVWVNTLGLLGEKYIEIIPGENQGQFISHQQSIEGIDPVPMHEITRLAKNIADDLDEVIVKIKNKEGTVGKLLYDDTIYIELEAMVKDLRRHPWKLFWKTKEKPEKKAK